MFVGRAIKIKNEYQVVQVLELVLWELIPFSTGFAFALEDSIRFEGVKTVLPEENSRRTSALRGVPISN